MILAVSFRAFHFPLPCTMRIYLAHMAALHSHRLSGFCILHALLYEKSYVCMALDQRMVSMFPYTSHNPFTDNRNTVPKLIPDMCRFLVEICSDTKRSPADLYLLFHTTFQADPLRLSNILLSVRSKTLHHH